MPSRSLLILTLVPAVSMAQVQVIPSADAPVVTLSVQETTEVAPDLATISAGVETVAPTAAAALGETAVKMARVLDAVRAAGTAPGDVRTNVVRIGARYDYRNGTRVFLGYAASNTVAVLLHNVRQAGGFLDRVTAAGATSVDGPNFSVDQPERYRTAARDRAVKRADAQAYDYARRTGFRQARLLSITEQGSFVQPYDVTVTGSRVSVSAPAAPRVATEVVGGQQSVGVSISAVYRLER